MTPGCAEGGQPFVHYYYYVLLIHNNTTYYYIICCVEAEGTISGTALSQDLHYQLATCLHVVMVEQGQQGSGTRGIMTHMVRYASDANMPMKLRICGILQPAFRPGPGIPRSAQSE